MKWLYHKSPSVIFHYYFNTKTSRIWVIWSIIMFLLISSAARNVLLLTNQDRAIADPSVFEIQMQSRPLRDLDQIYSCNRIFLKDFLFYFFFIFFNCYSLDSFLTLLLGAQKKKKEKKKLKRLKTTTYKLFLDWFFSHQIVRIEKRKKKKKKILT